MLILLVSTYLLVPVKFYNYFLLDIYSDRKILGGGVWCFFDRLQRRGRRKIGVAYISQVFIENTKTIQMYLSNVQMYVSFSTLVIL